MSIIVATWIALTTAYAPSCGDSGLTFYGLPTGPGTISAPASVPAFSQLSVEGYGAGIVTDRGPAIGEGRLDVWMATCAAARAWGRRWTRIERVEWREMPATEPADGEESVDA